MDQQTVTPDATPAAPSAAPVRADAVLQSLSSEEKSSWEMTGDLPERISITSKGEKDTATPAVPPVEQAASTDATTQPASEPGKAPKEKGAKARISELDAEIERDRQAIQERLRTRALVREELSALDRPNKDARQPEPSTGKPTTQAEWERFAAMPDAPNEDDFASVRDYTIAMSLFVSDKRDGERAQRARMTDAQTRHAESVKKTVDSAAQRIEAYRAKDPDLESKINPDLTAVVPAKLVPRGQAIGPDNALMQEILDSDFTPELFIHFSTPEGQTEWNRLCQLGSQNPAALLRAFGRVEARFESSKADPTPAPKHVSSAPTPPVTLGSRTADTSDPLESAIKRKDTAAYIREANKRDLAALGL